MGARADARVCEHEAATGALGDLAHLCDTALVQRGGANVARDVVGNEGFRQLTVEFRGLVPERGLSFLDVAVGADHLLTLHAHHLAGALGARAVQERQHAAWMVGKGELHQACGYRKCNAGGAQRPLVRLHGPGVVLQALYDVAQVELAVLDGLQEAQALLVAGTAASLVEAERLLHLLQRGILVAAEDVRLGALLVPDLVHLHDGAERDKADKSVARQQFDGKEQRCL